MGRDAIVLEVLRKVYRLSGGDPRAEVRPHEVGESLGFTSFTAAGYLGVLIRLGHLSPVSHGFAVRLTGLGTACVEQDWADLRGGAPRDPSSHVKKMSRSRPPVSAAPPKERIAMLAD